MPYKIKNYSFTEKFQCLGSECEDTCCKGWGMQVDTVRKELYEKEAPELLDAITSGEADIIMKRDPETDYCIKFDDGICSVHKEKGTKFLGDACHFYPRITRRFGDNIMMSAALSCPEIARLALLEDGAFELKEVEVDRIPVETKDYLPEGMDPKDAEKVIGALSVMAGDKDASPERIMSKIVSIAHSIESRSAEKWVEGIDIIIKMSDGMLPMPEEGQFDHYHLLNSFAGLIHASKKTDRPRLDKTFKKMEEALGIEIDRETLEVMQNVGQEDYLQKMQEKWQQGADREMASILRKWIQAQLIMSSFPFAGFGRDIKERAIIIGIRFALIKLALMSHMGEDGTAPDNETAIRVIQSIARFIDHLADPELSMNMYSEAGWTREARLRALIGDC